MRLEIFSSRDEKFSPQTSRIIGFCFNKITGEMSYQIRRDVKIYFLEGMCHALCLLLVAQGINFD